MKYYFPGKFGNPLYLENNNPDRPETKIIGISVIVDLKLVDKILEIMKYYFPAQFVNPRYSENNFTD